MAALIDRMLDAIEVLVTADSSMARCQHLGRDVDFYCPVLQAEELLCRACATARVADMYCDHCGGAGETRSICLLTFEKYGSSHIQDHYFAALCDCCLVYPGSRPTGSRLVTAPDGRTVMLVFRPLATEWTGTLPVMWCTEQQEQHGQVAPSG